MKDYETYFLIELSTTSNLQVITSAVLILSLQDVFHSHRWTVWFAAIFGTIYTLFYLEKNKLLETLFYVLVGVLPGVFIVLFNSSSVDE